MFFAYYLLKVALISAILYGYYLLALKDKRFHLYNRFYLLLAVAGSLVLPLISVEFWSDKLHTIETLPVQVLKSVDRTDIFFESVTVARPDRSFNFETVALVIFGMMCFAILLYQAIALLKILRIKKQGVHQQYEDISIVFTEDKSAPFSFLKNVFWNTRISIQSSAGAKILRHELAHIRERHSYDNIFINAVLVVFWANPVFWLVRKELLMIHEFIADKKTIEDGDLQNFSELILQSAYPDHFRLFTNPFFLLTYKTKNKNAKTK